MLRHLRIRNFALLDDVELELQAGLTVLTGETGAGKSLIAQAVALLRGGRASADAIRTGTDEAQVEALFEIEAGGPLAATLEAAGLPPGDEPGSLLVRRLLTRAGRGRVYLNGALGTVGQLTELVGGLIVSTPSGSTAYTLAAGGPILRPDLDAMVVTPICPFTLADRPLVLPGATRLRITLGKRARNVVLTVDGQWGQGLQPGDYVEMERARNPLRLYRSPTADFFEILRTKHHWGREPQHGGGA